ncbi:MAG TPA: bifunctional D-glycero-beta-D-manno-heptose-7-phosphate kinase/D-glycero-beta-D-manno-heptose 1-phosphate adenylyltransferase HldE [Nevskiaceae bacterium]|nr:bifunctional D-glycero-beta-D-manno-heptose-7-phosphate kinase/D-glycero-beta-D-manno-heptose 1-phosphate adenylyltransferase HldE [Nevskiaceae bacterium]
MNPAAPPLPDFRRARVLVVGDVMLDRYWSGPTQRISPEAPVPVVQVRGEEARPGGAANVALNLRALGCEVHLVGVVGRDEAAAQLRQRLEAAGVALSLIETGRAPTITKLRVLSRHHQVLRLDFEQRLDAPGVVDPAALLAAAARGLEQADVLLLSDYGKGTLADPPALIAAARQRGCPVLIDPKGSDYQRYAGATLLTPNVPELEAVVGACADEAELVSRGEALRRQLGLAALLVTRSEKGMSLLREAQPPLHLPTLAREVYDVTGAGDTVIATLAAALAAGSPLEQAVWLANAAAGVVVGKVGTATVSPAELAATLQPGPSGLMDEPALLSWRERQRHHGRRVVMTNGCFDLLHVGHLRYLQAARALGDALVVALNDDASVRRLKGESRPLNPLAARAELLAGLACVDAVVAFAEDTPARLIAAVLPDVLVKGGDYTVAQIAGGEAVRAAGGEVRVLDFHPGHSTTALIERARARP